MQVTFTLWKKNLLDMYKTWNCRCAKHKATTTICNALVVLKLKPDVAVSKLYANGDPKTIL